MYQAKRVVVSVLILMAFMVAGSMTRSQAQTTEQQGTSPDNTKMNAQDRDKASPTADQQKDNRSDREITQQIRQSLVKDKSLSSYGHNVKVITQNGQVRLKGPVRSEDEKKAIEAKATEVAGENKVTSELNIKQQ
ncbi:MAG TPA: BON domain-containing protein [Terriglobales bacterium]|jgi:hyperosmotically inducible protein|nr:BON domain-containing protein [Terriglobales bacterium]